MIIFPNRSFKIMYFSWTEVFSNVLLMAYLSKLTAVVPLYFVKCWKIIPFTNSYPIKYVFSSTLGLVPCILIKGFLKRPCNVPYIKVNGSSPSVFSWKFKNDYFYKQSCQNHVFLLNSYYLMYFEESFFQIFQNVIFVKVNGSSPTVFS